MPSLDVQLEPGKTVTVRLEKAGYVTQEFSYTVPATPATVTKTMVAVIYEIKIVSVAPFEDSGKPGDSIRISLTLKNTGDVATAAFIQSKLDGSDLGGISTAIIPVGLTETKSFSFTIPSVPPGSYTLIVEVGPAGKDVTDSRTFGFTVLPTTGTLAVTSTPSGATVTISGVFGTFTTPFTKALDAGTYTLTITKAGYKDKTDTVTIVAGETTTKHYTLELAAVTITFVTRKADASILTGVDVFVDGVKKGIT